MNYTPMLAQAADRIPGTPGWLFEVKWDGARVQIVKHNDGTLKMYSRDDRDITARFPEIFQERDRLATGIYDGELCHLDEDGKPSFRMLMSRMHRKEVPMLGTASRVVLYLFDCLELDDIPLITQPFSARRIALRRSVRWGGLGPLRLSEAFEDGQSLWTSVKGWGLEGVMAKRKDSAYSPGRSSNWLKIKVRETMDAVIVGYTRGEGHREYTFGALHLARPDGTSLGKVGTGFKDQDLILIRTLLDLIPVEREDKESVWLKPLLMCEVTYSQDTGQALREPVFVKLKLELAKREEK